MKTEHLTNTLVSVATRGMLVFATLAVGPVSPALADRIPFMPPYSRRARRQFPDLLKLAGVARAAFPGEPSPFSR